MEDRNGFYKPTKAEKDSERMLEEGLETSDRISRGREGSKRLGSAAAGLAKTTPVGRALSAVFGWGKTHKKGVVTGGGILGSIIGIAIFISSIIAPSQLIWMNAVFQDFNYGPYNRNVVRRAFAVKDAFVRPAQTQNRSQLGQKMQAAASAPERGARIAATDPNMVSKYNRRVPHRTKVSNRINTIRARHGKPPFNWRIFRGISPNSYPTGVSPRLMLKGVTDDSRPARRTGRGSIDSAIEEAKQADNPNERRSILRRTARRAGISTAAALSTLFCLSAVYDDMWPDDDELYELFLTYAATFNTAGSQLAAGEDVHGDEVADALEAYFETVEVDIDDRQSDEVQYIDNEVEFDEDNNPVLRDPETIGGVENEVVSGTVHRDFSQSAAWKRATNQPVSGNEEDIDLSYNLDIAGISGFFRGVGGAANFITGGNAGLVCTITGAIGLPLIAAEIVITFKTAGLGQAAVKLLTHGAILGATIAMMEQLTFDNIMPDGPVMQTAMADAGMNLTQAEVERAQGAPPISNTQANERRNENMRQLAMEDRDRGFVWRYFSLENHRSVIARAAITHQANLTPAGIMRSVARIPANLPDILASTFSKPASAREEFNNYNIQQYSWVAEDLQRVFGTSDLARIDVLENAEYVENALGCGGAADLGTGDDCSPSKTREGEIMYEIFTECISDRWDYWQLESGGIGKAPSSIRRLCTNPTQTEKDAWIRVGLWRLDNEITDSLECLSHDQEC